MAGREGGKKAKKGAVSLHRKPQGCRVCGAKAPLPPALAPLAKWGGEEPGRAGSRVAGSPPLSLVAGFQLLGTRHV